MLAFRRLPQSHATVEGHHIEDKVEALAVLIHPGRANPGLDAALLAIFTSMRIFDVVGNVGWIVAIQLSLVLLAFSLDD